MIPCVPDDRCVCADSSFVRELVNVTLEGLSCYACEPRRPPACTEDTDQCTPEACECADSSTHVKQAATTTSGTMCHFCEPIGGVGARFGLSEAAIIAMLVSLVFICQWGGKKTSSGIGKGNLRLSRRQGDRSRAIKVHQESAGFLEECCFIVGDVFDALIAGSCELIGCIWNSLCFICGAVASLFLRIGGCADAVISKVYAAFVQYGQRCRDGASHAAKAITNKSVPKAKLELASAQNGNKATAPGVRKRGVRKDSKVCNVADTNAGPPASLPQEAPRTQECVVCTSGNRSRDDAESKATASGNNTPARHHSDAPASRHAVPGDPAARESKISTPIRHQSATEACESKSSTPILHHSAAKACENKSSTPMGHQSAAEACESKRSTPMGHQSAAEACESKSSTPMGHPSAAEACESKSSKPMRHQSAAEACESENSTPMEHQLRTKATDLVDDSSAAHEDNSSHLECLSGDVVEPSLRRLSKECPQIGNPPRFNGAVNLTPLRTFLGEPVPRVELRRTASDSDLTLYN